MQLDKYIGSGLAFPIVINSSGRAVIDNGLTLLESNLKNIIFYPYNQRLFNEKYGCRINELLDEPNDNITRTLIRTFIIESINNNETRISITDVRFINITQSSVKLQIDCFITTSNTEESFEFTYNKNQI